MAKPSELVAGKSRIILRDGVTAVLVSKVMPPLSFEGVALNSNYTVEWLVNGEPKFMVYDADEDIALAPAADTIFSAG